MLFKNITIINENLEVEENMYVATFADRIAYVSKEEPQDDFGEVYEGKGKLLMSGFVNSHAHNAMSIMRGFGENLQLYEWLEKKIYPFEDAFTHDAVYWSTMLSMAESLRYGITSSSDQYFWIDDMVRAVADSETKINLSRAIVCFDDSDISELPSVDEMKRCVKAYHGSMNGKILMEAGLHAEYTNTSKSARQLADLSHEMGLGMHVHCAETEKETQECRLRHGVSPVKFFYDNGVFNSRSLAAHCVWLTDEDYELLKEKDVTVAVNPISNMKLASGICDADALLHKGIRVGIGTDSVASNNSLNFFEEIKDFALCTKVKTGNPTLITPKQALEAATYSGAFGQGRLDTGKLKEGFKADLIVIDISVPNMNPAHSLLNNLVYSCDGPVEMTVVDGKILYNKGEYTTIDIEKTIFEANRNAYNISARIQR